MSATAGLTINQFSADFRQRYLAISGGWLGTLTISISKTLGIWDPLVAFFIAVIAYSIVRTSSMMMALIIGSYFDGLIPYQYYHVKGSYQVHRDHLDDYWPMFLVGSLIEIGALLLLDHNAFTLLVCLKSLALCWLWMGRRKDGVFLSTALRKGKLGKPSNIPLGGIDWIPASRPTNTAPSAVVPQTTLPPFPTVANIPNARDQIQAKYKDPWTQWGMLHSLNDLKEGSREGVLKQWMEEPHKASRDAKYGKLARDMAAASSTPAQNVSTAASTASAPLFLPSIPSVSGYSDGYQALESKYKDPWTRWGMMNELKGMRESSRAGVWKQWTEQPYSETRAAKYKAKAQKAAQQAASSEPNERGVGLPSTNFTGSGQRVADAAEGGSSDQITVNSPARGVGMDLTKADRLLSRWYPDKIVREGMIESYRQFKTQDKAERTLHRWLTEKDKIARRTGEYRQKGQLGRYWRNVLNDARVPVFTEPEYKVWNDQLSKLYPDPWVRYGILTKQRRLPDEERPAKMARIIKESDGESRKDRTIMCGRMADEVRELFDDVGRDDFEHVKKKTRNLTQHVAGGYRGGRPLSPKRLKELDDKMKRCQVMWMERDKILEVFSRPRAKSQERAALARLRSLGLKFALNEDETWRSPTIERSKLDPEMAQWLRNKIGEGYVEPKDKRRTMAILNSGLQSKQEMAEVGELLSQLGTTPRPSLAEGEELAFDTKDLYDFRLKLLKGYGDSYIVDIIESEVMQKPSAEEATDLANKYIEIANRGEQDAIKAELGPRARRLEEQVDELRRYYKKNIAEVMKVDILFDKRDEEIFEYYMTLAKKKDSEPAIAHEHAEVLAACKERAVDESYFEHWRKRDLSKEGKGLNGWLNKIGLGKHSFTSRK